MKHPDLPLGLRELLLDILLDPLVAQGLTGAEWAWVEGEVQEVVAELLGVSVEPCSLPSDADEGRDGIGRNA